MHVRETVGDRGACIPLDRVTSFHGGARLRIEICHRKTQAGSVMKNPWIDREAFG